MALSADIFRRIFSEIFHIQRQQKARKIMRQLRKPVQPWVTILLYGESDGLETTLRSLRKSHYHNYDIVTVGHRAQTYQTAYRKSKRGKIVIPLEAGVEVDPAFIKRAVAMKDGERSWKVEIKVSLLEVDSFNKVITCLQKILWKQSRRVEVFIAAELKKKKINRRSSVLPKLTPVLTQVIAIGLIVAGVTAADLLVLWYAWILVSAYTLTLVWLSSDVRMAQRASLSLAVPSALFLVPVASIIEGIFQLSTRK